MENQKYKIEKKLLMTKVAKGEITEKEAQKIIKSKKVDEIKLKQEFEGKNAHKRKLKVNAKGG